MKMWIVDVGTPDEYFSLGDFRDQWEPGSFREVDCDPLIAGLVRDNTVRPGEPYSPYDVRIVQKLHDAVNSFISFQGLLSNDGDCDARNWIACLIHIGYSLGRQQQS